MVSFFNFDYCIKRWILEVMDVLCIQMNWIEVGMVKNIFEDMKIVISKCIYNMLIKYVKEVNKLQYEEWCY